MVQNPFHNVQFLGATR